jgi:hypothetical protein
MCREHFDSDAKSLAHYLLDQHVDFSHIGGNPSLPTLWRDPNTVWPDSDDPGYRHFVDSNVCYCHGLGAPSKVGVEPFDQDQVDVEWAYLIDAERLIVLRQLDGWPPAGHADWAQDTDTVNWTQIECGSQFEFCTHYAWVHVDGLPEECSRLSMETYLGRRPYRPEDAIGYRLADGVEVTTNGSGYDADFAPHGPARDDYGKGLWIQSVAFPDGTHRDIPVCYQTGSRAGEYVDGIIPLFPPMIAEVGLAPATS